MKKQWFIPLTKKRFLLIIVVMSFAIFILGSLNIFCRAASKNNDPVAYVNDEKIAKGEFQYRLTEERIGVYQYFKEKYGAENSASFWETNFKGEIPKEIAKNKALEGCIKIKVEQLLAQKKGLVKDISYEGFMKKFIEENKTRKEKVANHQVIFGPVEFTEEQYFEYILSNMRIKLKTQLQSEELKVEEVELKKRYDDNKENFKKQTYRKLGKISISYIDGNDNLDEVLKKKSNEKIKEALEKLESGQAFETVAGEYNKDKKLELQILDEASERADGKYNAKVKLEAEKLSKDQHSPIFEENGSFVILYCMEKESSGYQSFEEVKEEIKQRIMDEKYDKLINELVKKAKVKITV